MIAIPSIVLLTLLALLSFIASAVLRKPWMRYVAQACAGIEIALALFLVIICILTT